MWLEGFTFVLFSSLCSRCFPSKTIFLDIDYLFNSHCSLSLFAEIRGLLPSLLYVCLRAMITIFCAAKGAKLTGWTSQCSLNHRDLICRFFHWVMFHIWPLCKFDIFTTSLQTMMFILDFVFPIILTHSS